jgi:excisionase family DNA binding protein
MTTPGSPGRISRKERAARAAIGMPAGHPNSSSAGPAAVSGSSSPPARRDVARRQVHRDRRRGVAAGPAARNPRLEVNTVAAGTTAPGGTGDRQPEGLLLTVDEAAERLRFGSTLVYRLISSGELESVTVGRLRRVPAEYFAALRRTRRRAQPMAAVPPEPGARQRRRNPNLCGPRFTRATTEPGTAA